MQLHGKKVLVVGAGKSGLAVSRFLAAKGARVTLTDRKGGASFNPPLASLVPPEVELVLGHYPVMREGDFDLVVTSPGVPWTAPPLVRARELGLPVTGELELAFHFARAPVVAITGTNGKTTTTSLVGRIFLDAGVRTLVAGNIGLPLIEGVEAYGPGDLIVVEVSSFQLETVRHFRPHVAAILNITPDHLDRHGTMEGYVQAKARIFAGQGEGDYTVLNYDDPITRELAGQCPGRVIFFSRQHNLEAGVFVRDGQIVIRDGGALVSVMPAREVAIPGGHNLENALAAVACARVRGIGTEQLAHTLRTFSGVPHRLEFVAEINGVSYINDSKGTNPEASMKALEAYDRPIVLLAGGKNKGNDFTAFARRVKEKVRVLVVLGQCAAEMERAARAAGVEDIRRAADFREAVLIAHRAARPGDVVLLSPACASWDMFRSYEERGDLFKQIVRELARHSPEHSFTPDVSGLIDTTGFTKN
ncbi:MAG: UDP-N-acetylmuramoyl-L-alanine--D-glutamate ligase [Thermoanaerobacteraceae bacterium]|nr:UDP-N-acetylmuramoyl-L-alanine--D-glutamate ligase [Thermoanaerobacteraceae bacterium]